MKKLSLLLVGILICTGCTHTVQVDKNDKTNSQANNVVLTDSDNKQELENQELAKEELEKEEQSSSIQEQKEDTNEIAQKTQEHYNVIKENELELNIEDMNLWKLDNSVEGCQISVYTSAIVESNEEILLDDNNEFFILASIQGKQYILLDREHIQLGVPEVSIYVDYEVENEISIIVSDMRTAQCKINQYVYRNNELQCYELINKSGGNYITVV